MLNNLNEKRRHLPFRKRTQSNNNNCNSNNNVFVCIDNLHSKIAFLKLTKIILINNNQTKTTQVND